MSLFKIVTNIKYFYKIFCSRLKQFLNSASKLFLFLSFKTLLLIMISYCKSSLSQGILKLLCSIKGFQTLNYFQVLSVQLNSNFERGQNNSKYVSAHL